MNKAIEFLNQFNEDWEEGECAYFAAALHRIFGYTLVTIEGYYEDEDGEEVYTLGHAMGRAKSGNLYDVNGKSSNNLDSRIELYKEVNSDWDMDVSEESYDNEREFWNEMKERGSPKDEDIIKKAEEVIKSDISKYKDD